jgi:HMG (high mobility group) box
MNISPDASLAPLSHNLSGEVTGRMQSSSSNASPDDTMQDLKKASSSRSGPGTSKIPDALMKLPSDLKKPPASVVKKGDGGECQVKVESKKGEEKMEDDVDKDVDEEPEDEEKIEGSEDDGASDSAPTQSESGKAETKKRRARKKWKKPKDKPNRPLSAYNLFFRKERALLLGDDADKAEQEKGKKRVHRKTHGKIGFAQMARIIGAKWKTLPEEEKSEFEEVAGKEKKRYAEELAGWKEEQKRKAALERKNSKAKGKDSAMAGDGDDGGSMSENHQQEALKMQMMQGMSRGNLPFFGADGQQRQMPTIEYLRAMQDERAASSLFGGGRPAMGNNFSSSNQYPNAAEASASALLQQFQTNPGMMPQAAFASAAAGMDGSGRNDMERLQQLQMARMMNSAMMGGPMGGTMTMGGPMSGSMNMGVSMGGGSMGAGFSQMGGSNNQPSQQLEFERLQQQMFFQNQVAAGMKNQMMGGNFGGLNNSNNSNSNNSNMNESSQGGGGGSTNSNMKSNLGRFQNRFNMNL